ncbi:glycosyltransferase family 4 protein [Lusitaniella coriacea]|uniref:glycosyltransferase family 4 protein n=1 Tax=Lusitaniella coriacea TaxID=1983105 RepID=UPI003CF5CBD3
MNYSQLKYDDSPAPSDTLKKERDRDPELIPQRTAQHIFVFLEIFNQEGGIQSYVKDIFSAYLTLAQQESRNPAIQPYHAEVFVLRDTSNCDNPFESQFIKFHYLGTSKPWLGRIKLSASLVARIVKQRPDRVFCGHINLAPLVGSVCQSIGIPYTVLTYGKEVWEILTPLKKKALDDASEIWTISRYSRDRACEANQLDPQNIQLLPCIVNCDVFTPGEKPKTLLERYDLGGSKVLMTVARLWSGDRYKGVDVTIRALPEIAKSFPDIKYLVIGRGDDQPRLAQLAEDLGVRDRVVFAGFVPTEELPDHYRVADAYVMPSQEGFGIVYLEAMACGIPVVSGNADGSSEPLQDGKVGWQVPRKDEKAVATACIEILSGNDKRSNGQWLREQCVESFSKDALTHRLQELLDRAD